MSRDIISKISQTSILSPKKLKKNLSLSHKARNFIASTRNQISHMLHKNDKRMLLIIGPCSVHNVQEAKEFGVKIKELQEQVKNDFLILMRVYFAKPRTSIGWKGLMYDPDLNESCNIQKGILLTRQLLVDLVEMGVPVASEFLDPLSVKYFDDLIAWGCIGARTSESQIHREVASGLSMPIGFKNSTQGCIQVAVNGVLAASKPHSYLGIQENGTISLIDTSGNTDSHVVLRGGNLGPNYDPKTIADTSEILKRNQLVQKVLVDCSHGNSGSNACMQTSVFESVLVQSLEGNKNILGMILESYFFRGNQKLTFGEEKKLIPGVSVTDACLDWETTEKLVLWAKEKINRNKSSNLSLLHDLEISIT